MFWKFPLLKINLFVNKSSKNRTPNYSRIHSRRNRSYLFQIVVSNHWGCTPRGVRGKRRTEILWEIQKYSLPGRPFSQNWVKPKKTRKRECINFHKKLANGFWFYTILAWWSTWQWVCLNFSQNFWSFDTIETSGSVSTVFAENEIRNRLKQFLPVWDYQRPCINTN